MKFAAFFYIFIFALITVMAVPVDNRLKDDPRVEEVSDWFELVVPWPSRSIDRMQIAERGRRSLGRAVIKVSKFITHVIDFIKKALFHEMNPSPL